MSQLHLSRRSAAVGLGSLALVLVGGPALAVDPVSSLDKATASVTAPLEPVVSAVEPVVPAIVPAAPAPAPAPAPVPKAVPRAAAATDPITAIVAAVVKQVDKITAPQKAPAPVAGQASPSSTANQLSAPAAPAAAAVAPVEVRGNALTAAAIALGSRTDAGDSAAPLAFSPLGGLARGMAAGLPPLAPSVSEFSPTLALPGVAPQPAVAQSILPISSPAGPNTLPGLLVALAVMAVAVTAAGHVSEAQRRRPTTTA